MNFLEATQTGIGGFKSPADSYYIKEYKLTPKAISSGSDLRAVSPRELLGIFLGFRGRHMRDTNRRTEAEPDYLLARHLFPSNRQLYIQATEVSVGQSLERFEPGEKGSPTSLADWINWDYGWLVPKRSSQVERKAPVASVDLRQHHNHSTVIVQTMRSGK